MKDKLLELFWARYEELSLLITEEKDRMEKMCLMEARGELIRCIKTIMDTREEI